MLDFLKISRRKVKKDILEIYPTFIISHNSSDLMIRGRDFYAVWDDVHKTWSTFEQSVIDQVDMEIGKAYEEAVKDPANKDLTIVPKYMWDADSGIIDKWHKYCQKQCRDRYHQLDEKVIFSNSRVSKRDYSSKRLDYALEEGDISAYDELMSVLYSPEERDKLEWAIGSVVAGDSKKIQKFIFLYGGPRTGKSTVLNIVQMLFSGYYCIFDAKELGNSNSSFALESFKDNPLVGIQHDGDLSRIDDNTRLNSIVSHETMEINEKFKSKYTAKFNTFLFIGSNKMVKITDAKSGLTRRVIDVNPSGNAIPFERYSQLMEKIETELGAIAKHCLDRYNELGINYYSKYVPTRMIEGTNEFYNFIQDYYFELMSEDQIPLKKIWTWYKQYCLDANVKFPMSRNAVRNELMNYFDNCEDEVRMDGRHVRNVYSGFKQGKFMNPVLREGLVAVPNKSWLELKKASEINGGSVIDREYADCPAQYATEDRNEKPLKPWAEVTTKLRDILTDRVHYVLPPDIHHIVIDFDLKDEDGNKSMAMNLEAAAEWPKTYAEVSKGGGGLHLHYIYKGDPGRFLGEYAPGIEIKVFSGLSALRRRLTLCNDLPIAVITKELPLKGETKVIDFKTVKSERSLRKQIIRNLNKEIHDSTKCSVDLIYKMLEDAYMSGLHYDVTDMHDDILEFAMHSTHQANTCMRTVMKMKLKSEEPSVPVDYENGEIIFFDVEVFPNLFVVVFKSEKDKPVRLINPSPNDILRLCRFKLIGFNNRKYDNHILYARIQGYNNQQLYDLSQRIIDGKDKNAFFGEAYNLSYTDIYDFSSKKKSLKKWEIELGIHHQELGLPWDKDVPEELWDTVAEYCENDVVATQAVFEHLKGDFVAREILSELAGRTVNDTTNSLTARIIFGDAKNPQSEFEYTYLKEMFPGYEFNPYGIDKSRYRGKIVSGKSIYRGEDPGEGGRVYAEPGMYYNVALLDVASMHPTSIEQLNLFGPYTKNFSDLKQARIYIKHKDYDSAGKLFDGRLKKYLTDEAMAKALSNALKIAINAVYGMTSASFDNKFKDPRNVDNIVAKRGALFMIDLQYALQAKGATVVHVKTDSVKIAEATPEIIDFVMKFGEKYGYIFEHEATYSKMCLVNESVYIAQYDSGEWTATGTQFQVPYVFKTLFSHEPIEFADMCETKSVTTALYLDMNENLPEGEHDYHFVGRVGAFCPIIPGAGGGLLLREKEGKYSAATGSKGFRWLESEMVKNLNMEDKIDRSYYDEMVETAKETITKYGDFEAFVK